MKVTNVGNINFSPDNQIFENNKENNVFEDFYDAYLNIYNSASAYEKTADELQLDFATGKTDDMLSVMMAQERAYTSLNFAVQMTNRIVDSYKQILQIQL